jgi:hypothetical protein
MNAVYHDLSALAAAAADCDCTAHMHQDEQGNPVYSIGSENIGAAEFSTYAAALEWATNRVAGDVAEVAGGDIANALLNDLMAARNQCRMVLLIQGAIVNLAKLPQHDRAAAGFAIGLVNVLEVGLEHLPKGGEQ